MSTAGPPTHTLAEGIDWDAVQRPGDLSGIFPPPETAPWVRLPALTVYRGQLARLGLPDPGDYRSLDLVEESIRLAGLPGPAADGLAKPAG